MPPKQEPLDRALALEMQSAAINEMRGAGFEVMVANSGKWLVVMVANAMVQDDAIIERTEKAE